MNNMQHLPKKRTFVLCAAIVIVALAITVQADWVQDILANNALYYNSSSERLGFGTTSPLSVLHAKSAEDSIVLFESTGTIARAAGIVPEGISNRINFIGYTDPAVDSVYTSMGGFQVRITDVDPNPLKTKVRLIHNDGDNLVEALTVADNSNVGIGDTAPSERLSVNGNASFAGYVQLDTVVSAPPAADCDETSEEGRMKFDPVSEVFYICATSGWVTK